MIVEQVIKKSSSGSTKWIDNVYFTINDAKSYASAILLKHYYWQRDEGNVNSIANRMRMIGFSRTYLTGVLKEKGKLCCVYCPKDNLIIELEGMVVSNGNKATIDHIIAISKGGAMFDHENICVACGTCNSKKSDKPVDEFIKNRKNNFGSVK
jgi:5-methylcytosine-specific restriction endonuclease McrA